LLFGDAAFYEPNHSAFTNIFDISWKDPKEHFIVPLLIGAVFQLRTGSTKEGFVDTRAVYARLQSIGYTPEQIDYAVARAVSRKLLEAPARQVPKPGQEMS
jgi:hypothetical protein